MTTARFLLAVAALTTLAGCSTIDNGTDDEVAVVTDPPGARAVSSTGTICTTPCAVSGPRKIGFTITIAKRGYATQTVTSDSLPTPEQDAASRNEITADYLGRVVDVQDGSYYHHVPAAIVVKLVPAH